MRCSQALMVLLLLTIPQVIFSAENRAKDFTLPSVTDKSLIHLSDYSGKVVLINWWRTSCAWSQKESPRLVELYKQHHDKGLVIIGVSDDTADTVAQVPAYLKRYGITWPVGLNDQGEFMREIRPLGQGDTPGNYLVSRSGEITYLGLDRNPGDWPKVEEAVVRALAQAPPANPAVTQVLPGVQSLPLSDLQGNPVNLQSFAGRPLVVNFFNAQTCDWAGAAVSKLLDLFDSDAESKACMAKYKVEYPVLRGDQATQAAWIGGSKAWGTFFITPDGKSLWREEKRLISASKFLLTKRALALASF